MQSTQLNEARLFAFNSHGEQKYGQHPYVYHLDAVASLLQPFGEEAQIVGYLHDVLEDTHVTFDELCTQFGQSIADSVVAVTDESGENRRQRKAKTNAKLALSTNTVAILVKTADRLANLLESQLDSDTGKLKMYRREHADFRNAVYRQGLCESLWKRIDDIIAPT